MASTLLGLASDICDDPGVSVLRPATLFGGVYDEGDTTGPRIVRALTKTCQHIASRYEWQTLKREHSFATVAAEIQPSGLPVDLLRVVQDTMWVAGLMFEGPVNDADWAAMRSGRLPQAWPAFRIYNNQMHLWPQPGLGQAVAYQYISNAVGVSAAGAPLPRFSADTDKAMWDDELVTLGAVYEYRKGLRKDYAQDQIDFEGCLANRLKADGGSKILSMGPGQNRSRGQRRPSVTLSTSTPRWGGSDW